MNKDSAVCHVVQRLSPSTSTNKAVPHNGALGACGRWLGFLKEKGKKFECSGSVPVALIIRSRSSRFGVKRGGCQCSHQCSHALCRHVLDYARTHETDGSMLWYQECYRTSRPPSCAQTLHKVNNLSDVESRCIATADYKDKIPRHVECCLDIQYSA